MAPIEARRAVSTANGTDLVARTPTESSQANSTTTESSPANSTTTPSPFNPRRLAQGTSVEELLDSTDSFDEEFQQEEANNNGDDCNQLFDFVNDDSKVASPDRIPYVLMLAETVIEGFSLDNEPYCNVKKKTTIKPQIKLQKLELLRRMPGLKGMTNKKREELSEMMKTKYPLTNQKEIEWIKQEEQRICEVLQREQDEANQQRERERSQGSARKMDRLRLIECIITDKCKPLYLKINDGMSRQQLDGRNSAALEADFYDVVCDVFNDEEIVFPSRRLPELHEDFAQSFPITLSDFRLTRDKAKELIAQQRVKIIRICSNWEASGNGDGQREPTDQDWGHYDSNTLDGVAQRNFLQTGDTTDLLYWWHLLDEEKLLHFTANVFTDAIAASADNVASLEPAKKKRKTEEDEYKRKVNRNMEDVGVGLKSLSYAALNRQISEARTAQFDLQMKLSGMQDKESHLYVMMSDRVNEFNDEIERLQNCLSVINLAGGTEEDD